MPGQALVQYRRSGGFAGLRDEVVIYSDRRVVLTQKSGQREFMLDDSALRQLEQRLNQAGFPGLQAEYVPANQCCDLIEHVVTYQGHSVRTMGASVPSELKAVLDALGSILERRGP